MFSVCIGGNRGWTRAPRPSAYSYVDSFVALLMYPIVSCFLSHCGITDHLAYGAAASWVTDDSEALQVDADSGRHGGVSASALGGLTLTTTAALKSPTSFTRPCAASQLTGRGEDYKSAHVTEGANQPTGVHWGAKDTASLRGEGGPTTTASAFTGAGLSMEGKGTAVVVLFTFWLIITWLALRLDCTRWWWCWWWADDLGRRGQPASSYDGRGRW